MSVCFIAILLAVHLGFMNFSFFLFCSMGSLFVAACRLNGCGVFVALQHMRDLSL